MKRLTSLLTIALAFVFCYAAASAQEIFTFNVKTEVYQVQMFTPDCRGTGCRSKYPPKATVSTSMGQAEVTLVDEKRFSVTFPLLKLDYTGTYNDQTLNAKLPADCKNGCLTTPSYAVERWDDKAQRRDLEKVKPLVLWLATHRHYKASGIQGGTNKLFYTAEAEQLIKKYGFTLKPFAFTLEIPGWKPITPAEYGPTIIFDKGNGYLEMRWIDQGGEEAVIAIYKNGSMKLLNYP